LLVEAGTFPWEIFSNIAARAAAWAGLSSACTTPTTLAQSAVLHTNGINLEICITFSYAKLSPEATAFPRRIRKKIGIRQALPAVSPPIRSPAHTGLFSSVHAVLDRPGRGLVLSTPEKREGAGEQGAEEDAVYFPARNFYPVLLFRDVGLTQLLDGSRANQDGPGAGEPDPELAEREGVGIFPASGEMGFGFVQVTVKNWEKPGLVGGGKESFRG
jgi:hypothetical protein